ncbi:MAG: hypothetical protein FWC43_08070, partial [Planctomycetaceae bacterium]|nr:hypothetical protein [Planctomycetaceae bacterium]
PPMELLRLRPGDFSAEVRDVIGSLAYGSCGLISGPSESKNTDLVQSIIKSLQMNDPSTLVFMLFLNKPDDVLRKRQQELQNRRCEVIGTFPGETIGRFVHLTDFLLEKAKRMVENGKDVLLCVDSLSPFLQTQENFPEGYPSRLFHAAKKTAKGSLTILATVLDEEADLVRENAIPIKL